MTLQEKQTYLLRLLTLFKGKRSLADGFLLLVQGNVLSEQAIDGILALILVSAKEVHDEATREALLHWHALLIRLQRDETLDREREERSLCELEEKMK